MNGKFAHLAKFHLKAGATAVFEVQEFDTPDGTLGSDGLPMRHPRITCLPATEENKPYWTKLVKRASKNAGRGRGRDPQELLKENREEDLGLFPLFVVVGWDGVFDTEGKAVPFSSKDALEYFKAWPNYVFDRLRGWASEQTNFLPEDQPSSVDIEVQAGN